MHSSRHRTARLLPLLLLSALFAGPRLTCAGADLPPTPFTKAVIDLGIVVADLDRSAAFYTNAIGFRELPGFNVPGEMAAKIGLTDHRAAKIRIFALGDGEAATKLKLMAFPDAGVAKPDRRFIHSTLGVNYLTLYVGDMRVALQRLKAAGVKLLGETPVELGGGAMLATFQDPDGTFIELVGPAKAP